MRKAIIAGFIGLGVAAAALWYFAEPPLATGIVEIPREDLERELGDGEAMKAAMTIAPHFDEGRMDGFSIVEVKRGSIAHRLGLKAGDLVTSIGGIGLDAPEAPFIATDRLKSAREAEVVIVRDGAEHRFVVRASE